MFFCGIYEIYKNSLFYKTPPATAFIRVNVVWAHFWGLHKNIYCTFSLSLFFPKYFHRQFSFSLCLTTNTKPSHQKQHRQSTYKVLQWLPQAPLPSYFRSSHPELFCQKGVLKNFGKFTGKHLCQSLFLIKLQARGSEKRLGHRCFPVNFPRFFKTPFYGTTLVAASSMSNIIKRNHRR